MFVLIFYILIFKETGIHHLRGFKTKHMKCLRWSILPQMEINIKLLFLCHLYYIMPVPLGLGPPRGLQASDHVWCLVSDRSPFVQDKYTFLAHRGPLNNSSQIKICQILL